MPEEMMCCGTANFKVVVDRCELSLSGGEETPRKEKKVATVAKETKAPEVAKAKKKPAGGKKENPYASLGLDKFSTVLAELESRREKVLRRVDGGADRVMVRFVQSGTKGWVPIVVKFPPEEQAADAAKGKPKKKCKLKSALSPPLSQPSTPRSTESSSPRGDDVFEHAAAAEPPAVSSVVTKKIAPVGRRWSWGKRAIRPSQYWPLAAVLLLVSLVVFGRVFAICCTTVLWYLVPILTGGEEEERRSAKTTGKDLGKKPTDKTIGGKLTWASLPPSHGKKNSSSGGAHEVVSPRSHAHGKKW